MRCLNSRTSKAFQNEEEDARAIVSNAEEEQDRRLKNIEAGCRGLSEPWAQ